MGVMNTQRHDNLDGSGTSLKGNQRPHRGLDCQNRAIGL